MDLSEVRLVVGIPHRNGECHVALLGSLVGGDFNGIRTVFINSPGTLTTHNRNTLVQMFLDIDFGGTHLLSLDTDISVPPDGFKKLLLADKDVISGLYVEKAGNGLVVRKRLDRYRYGPVAEWLKYGPQGPPWILKEKFRDKVLECDAAGAGCLLVKRRVFETVPPPWFFEDYRPDADKYDAFASVAEDLSFFWKVQQHGFKTYVHTGVLCEHWSQNVPHPPSWDESVVMAALARR